MFSLGLVICAVFNNGKPLIQANNNPMLYVKQIEFVSNIYNFNATEMNNIILTHRISPVEKRGLNITPLSNVGYVFVSCHYAIAALHFTS